MCWNTVKVRPVFLLYFNHGEVSDPNQDQGECALAHDQPLLSRCESACAVSGTQAPGQGPGGPATLSRPPWRSWVGTELQGSFQTSCPSPAPWLQPTSWLCRSGVSSRQRPLHACALRLSWRLLHVFSGPHDGWQ